MRIVRVFQLLIEVLVGIIVFGAIIFFVRSDVPFMLILIQLAALFIFNISFMYYMTKHEKYFEIPDYWKRRRQEYLREKYAKGDDEVK
jgi:uncharacterized membrane protein